MRVTVGLNDNRSNISVLLIDVEVAKQKIPEEKLLEVKKLVENLFKESITCLHPNT